jgi:hypothetical protein
MRIRNEKEGRKKKAGMFNGEKLKRVFSKGIRALRSAAGKESPGPEIQVREIYEG